MKVAIINDSHFGYSNSSELFIDYQKKFYENVFFPYCEKNGIKNILHLGDIFDNRKHISVKALHFVRTEFLEEIRKRNMFMNFIVGNHDCAFKNTNSLSSAYEILSYYQDCVKIHMEPEVLDFDGLKIGMVPWIAADNKDQCLDFIQTCEASILMGHFQISGFKLIANSGIKSEGLNKKSFERYDMVLSGHFHTKSHEHNIIYLGAQYQLNWSDVDDTKYFHILDTETRELTPKENPYRIYRKFYYDESEIDNIQDFISNQMFSEEKIKKSYIRVVVKKKTNLYQFDQFTQHIKSHEPYDLAIIENYDELTPNETAEETELIEDTSTLLCQHVDDHVNTHLDKNKLKQKLNELYIEASIEGTV